MASAHVQRTSAGRPSHVNQQVEGETVQKQGRRKTTSTDGLRSPRTRAASSSRERRRSTISERRHTIADRARRSRRSPTHSSRSKKR